MSDRFGKGKGGDLAVQRVGTALFPIVDGLQRGDAGRDPGEAVGGIV